MKKIEKETWEQLDKRGMQLSGFTIVYNELKSRISRDTSPQAAFLYITLLAHKNNKSKQTFPSVNTLAKELGVSSRTISNLLNDLYNAGYILINSGKTKVSNNYFFPYEPDYQEQLNDRTCMPYRRKTKGLKKKEIDDYDYYSNHTELTEEEKELEKELDDLLKI